MTDFLMGTVARLDTALALLKDFNTEGNKIISTELAEWSREQEDFLKSLENAKLFESMILKVQRPLNTNMKNMPEYFVLIYNQDKSLMCEVTINDMAYKWFGKGNKMFVRARLWSNGTLQLLDRTPDYYW